MQRHVGLLRPSLLALLLAVASAPLLAEERWRKHVINDRSPFEAAGVADFDGDGRLDIFSGDSWYQAPHWHRRKVRDLPASPNPHYHEDFADLPLDVNEDGRMDVITCAYFSRRIGWVEQPEHIERAWIEHTVDLPGSMETALLIDINGDKRPDLLPNVGGEVVWYEIVNPQDGKWKKHVLGKEGRGHGIGTGDINRDGREDILCRNGWYEQPAQAADTWTFHAEFELGAAGILILGHDFDGDGDTDIVWGMGHDYGLFWLEQQPVRDGKRQWVKQRIDTTFSQVHALQLADLNGDGVDEVVTGKRIYAHEGEPGATDAPCIYSFQYDRAGRRWVKQTLYEGTPANNAPADAKRRQALVDFERGSAGTGLQFEIRDMDQDGDLDLVCPGKSGLYLLENPRK